MATPNKEFKRGKGDAREGREADPPQDEELRGYYMAGYNLIAHRKMSDD